MIRRAPVRYLFTVWQLPLLVRRELRNSKRKTVPVGRILIILPSPWKVLPTTVVVVVVLELLVEDWFPMLYVVRS